MASLSPQVICWFLLLLASRTNGQQNCPQADSINPPSGTVGVEFTINGSDLEEVNSVIVGDAVTSTPPFSSNDTHLQFTLDQVLETGSVSVELVATRNPPCNNVMTTVDLRMAISFSSLVPSSGQTDTVARFTGLLPPTNGDNSMINSVFIGGVQAEILTQNSFILDVRIGPSLVAIPNANITIVTNYSTFIIANPTWDYTAPGNITMVTPSRGQEGTRVMISGENLVASSRDPQVLLAGIEAMVESVNSTTIICRAMSGTPRMGSVAVNHTEILAGVLYDTPTFFNPNSWEQLADGNITRIIPSAAAANTTILVCGDSPLGDSNETASVTVGGIRATQFSATSFIIESLTCINVTLPAGLTGINSIEVVANTGAIIRSQVNISIATISSTSQTMGQYGTRVNITGVELFQDITSTYVMLAGVNATIEDQDDMNRRWIVVRAGRPPSLFSMNMTENCTQSEMCVLFDNITSNCAGINCSTSFSNATFITEMCLTNCTGQNISVCYSQCSPDGTLNQTCFLQCGRNLNISINSTCLSTCEMPCCVNASSLNCTNVTTCINVTLIEPINVAFTGQVAIVTTELGLVFNLTSETILWTYNVTGRIDTVNPTFGQIGTRVALNGTNLFGYGMALDQLLVNGTRANVVFANDSVVQFDAPVIDGDRSSVGLVDIQLTSDSGAIVELAARFEYRTPGMINGFVPPEGQQGTYVNITGVNLLGYGTAVTEITFGSQSMDVLNATNASIFVRVTGRGNRNIEPVNVTIISDTFAMVSSSPLTWRFLVQGVVIAINPTVGQIGTIANITGLGLLGGGTSVASVYLDGVATNVMNFSDTSIVVRISENITQRPGTVLGEILIVADTGAMVTAPPTVTFTISEAGVITGFSPRTGREGTYVNITGINLLAFGNEITRVTIAGIDVPLDSIEANTNNPNTVRVRAGRFNSTISGNIVIYIDTGPIVTSNTTFNFTYVAPGIVTAITPSSGVEGVGVLITGEDLYIANTSMVSVYLAGAPVDRIVVDTTSTIAVIAGPPSANSTTSTEVLITASDGSISRGFAFTYDTPHQINITPSIGQHGTRVTINFPATFDTTNGYSVLVDNIPATVLNQTSSAATISIPRAQRSVSYVVDISVENSDGSVARLVNGFTYIAEGVINDVSPASGQRGTVVMVTGSGLLGGGDYIVTATLAGLDTMVTNSSNTSVILVVTSNGDNSMSAVGDVVLLSNTGAMVILLRSWTAVVPGVISTVSPVMGQFGTHVNITGSYLLQGGLSVSSVQLAGVEVYAIIDESSTSILVRAANASANLTGPVRIELETGAYVESTVNWTYTPRIIVSSAFPIIGAVGSTLMIRLDNVMSNSIDNVTMVTLGDYLASIISEPSPDYVEVTVPRGNYSTDPLSLSVETISGALVTEDNVFTIEELGNISTVYPTVIQQGITVNISGYNFLGRSNQTYVQAVWLAGVPANRIIEHDNMSVLVEAGYSASNVTGNVVIVLNTAARIYSMLNTTNVSYYPAQIQSITPTSGYNATRFNISGINLVQPNSSLMSVTISNITAMVEDYNYDYIIARAGEPTTSDINSNMTVRVTSQSGAYIESENSWRYISIPVITSVQPSNMSVMAGDNITIFGVDLPVDNATSDVRIGGVMVQRVLYANESVIVAQTSFGFSSADLQQVEITAMDGAVITSDPLVSFITVNYTIVSVSPPAGQNGTMVTITFNLLPPNINTVALAGVMATMVNVSNTTNSVTVVAGFGNNVLGDITVQGDGVLIGSLSGWRYLPVLDSSQVSPQRGQTGSLVTITLGTSLLTDYNVSNVTLAGVVANVNETGVDSIVVIAGASDGANLSDVVVYFTGGIRLTIPQSWTYLPPITVTTVSNNAAGYFGSIVTIYGTGFLNGQSPSMVNITQVLLANISTYIISYNDTQIVCNITQFVNSSSEAVIGPIYVRNSLGFSVNTSGILNFTYVRVDVMSVSPSQGQNGTIVTLQGVGLLAGATNITAVWLNGIPVRSIINYTDNMIVVQAGYSNTGAPMGDVNYRTSTGAMVTEPGAWSYVTPAVITNVDPRMGTEGTIVTILGTDLLAGADGVEAVYLDGVAASEIEVSSNTLIQVVAGTNPISDPSPGSVFIRLQSGAEVFASDGFSYAAPGNIMDISPMTGQDGTFINITGRSLYPSGDRLTSVTLAGVSATILNYNTSFIQLRAGRPAILESFGGPVVITAESGAILTHTTNFTYLQEGIIFSVTPSQGQNETITEIKGQDLFGGGTSLDYVQLAGVTANIDTVSSNTTCVRVTARENPSSNNSSITGDILLRSNTGARVRRVDGWTYVQRGVIDTITPQSGQYGTVISIMGQRLLSGSTGTPQVTIGGVTVTVTSSNDTMITGVVGDPAHGDAYNDTVSITSSDGGLLMTNFVWSFNQRGIIANFTPTEGDNEELITITGTNLLGSGTMIVEVLVAGINAMSFTVNNTYGTITAGILTEANDIIGPIRLIANTGAIVESTGMYTFSSPCRTDQFVVPNSNPVTCGDCDSVCDTCAGPTDSDCRQCSSTSFIVQTNGTAVQCTAQCIEFANVNRQCVGSCLAGQYQNHSDIENTTFCLDCSDMCAPNTNCSGPEPTQCAECRFVRYQSECIAECPQGTYLANNNNTCQMCHPLCDMSAGCTGPLPTECRRCANFSITSNITGLPMCIEQCPSNYYISGTSCLPCDPLCEDGCSGNGPFRCDRCRFVGMRSNDSISIQCLSNCDVSSNNIFYLDNSTNLCERCNDLCSVIDGCNGPTPSDCLSCRNQTFMFNGTCRLECSSVSTLQYYGSTVTGNCELCDDSCGRRGCTGPGRTDCIMDEPEDETDTFDAGIGTIIIVIVVCIVLLLLVLLCAILFLFTWNKHRSGKYYPQVPPPADYEQATEMASRYAVFKPEKETKFDNKSSAGKATAASTKTAPQEPTADELYTEMSGGDTLKRPLTMDDTYDGVGPDTTAANPTQELYIDVPNSPGSTLQSGISPSVLASQDVGGEEYVDVSTPGVITNPGYSENDDLYEDTDQAIESAKAYVRLQKVEKPEAPPSLPPSRGKKPPMAAPANPLQSSLSRLQQPPPQEPDDIYEEAPVEECLYDAIGGGGPEVSQPPSFKPPAPKPAQAPAPNALPLPPK